MQEKIVTIGGIAACITLIVVVQGVRKYLPAWLKYRKLNRTLENLRCQQTADREEIGRLVERKAELKRHIKNVEQSIKVVETSEPGNVHALAFYEGTKMSCSEQLMEIQQMIEGLEQGIEEARESEEQVYLELLLVGGQLLIPRSPAEPEKAE